MTDQPLSGLKVIEWGNFVSAPFCAKLLADLGAEVIKVEAPEGGDDSRRHGPFLRDIPHPEKSGLFLNLNMNKLGVTLDIGTPTGRDILLKLLEEADVFVENNPPKLMKDLRLSYPKLRQVNKRLIMTSITPFGQVGRYKDYKAYDINACGVGGISVSIGAPEREPLTFPIYQASYGGGLGGAIATMAAVLAREFTGKGQHIDVSIADILATLGQGHRITNYIYRGVSGLRMGHRHGFGMGYPQVVLPCKDGYVNINAPQLAQWIRFLEWMGNPEWTKNPRYRDRRAMAEQYPDECDSLLIPWLKERTKEELFAGFRERHIPFAPVMTIEEVVNDPHLQERGFFVELDRAETGRLKYPGAPYRLAKTPWKASRPAPLLGEHNEEVYGRLGYSPEYLTKLRRARVI